MQNIVYELTKFITPDIPDSKLEHSKLPAVCPHCEKRDRQSVGYEGHTVCGNCGEIYFITRLPKTAEQALDDWFYGRRMK